MSSEAAAAALQAAVGLLAHREHSATELRRKLGASGHGSAAIDAALAELAEQGLQSDARFAEAYARARFERGYGPLSIRAGLRERGVSEALASAILATFDELWMTRLAELAGRRFGDAPAADVRERARRSRFLQQRGYTPAQVARLLHEP